MDVEELSQKGSVAVFALRNTLDCCFFLLRWDFLRFLLSGLSLRWVVIDELHAKREFDRDWLLVVGGVWRLAGHPQECQRGEKRDVATINIRK